MAQVLKPEVRERILHEALRRFADDGYAGASLGSIAASAGTATANIYRYFPSKEALFRAAIPPDLLARHDELVDRRVEALAKPVVGRSPAAEDLLEFWLANRLAIVVLLDRAAGTPYAGYPQDFVRRLVGHVERVMTTQLSGAHRHILWLVFDNTRRALAEILRTANDGDEARALIAAFWSYQLPGLDGLLAFFSGDHPGSPESAAPLAEGPPR
jgi:AcrR family transcriptional regulator